MVEVVLQGLAAHVEEATIHTWFFEEGDAINEGDDLVEVTSEEGTLMIASPVSGILAEVYYDEGELIAKGEILCTIDNEEPEEAEDEDEEEDDDDDDDEKEKDEE